MYMRGVRGGAEWESEGRVRHGAPTRAGRAVLRGGITLLAAGFRGDDLTLGPEPLLACNAAESYSLGLVLLVGILESGSIKGSDRRLSG